MLKGIPNILSPELLKILMEMGHGDEIVIVDGNYPAASHAKRLVRLDAHGVPPVLEAVVKFFPLDQFVDQPVTLMAKVPGSDVETPIWDVFRDIVAKEDERAANFGFEERFAFYERAKQAYAIVATGESALYANIILKKGVIA